MVVVAIVRAGQIYKIIIIPLDDAGQEIPIHLQDQLEDIAERCV